MECACNYRTPLKYGLSPENMIGVYIVIVKDFVQFQRRNANSVVMHDEIRFGLNVWSFEADETIKGDVQVCTQGFYMPAAMAIRCCRLS